MPNRRIPSTRSERWGKVINSYTVSIEASANLVVMRTFPGAASVVASALDAALEKREIGRVLGTVAGDDTILVVAARNWRPGRKRARSRHLRKGHGQRGSKAVFGGERGLGLASVATAATSVRVEEYGIKQLRQAYCPPAE